jgi:hypothetical protein
MAAVSLRQYVSLPLVVLFAANLYPLYGVLERGWDVFELLFLFWAENVVIGLFNILKMLANRPRDPGTNIAKFFFVPFFTFHYGMFTFAHGIFVIALFAPKTLNIKVNGLADYLWHSDVLLANGVSTAISLLFVSHAVSFYADYIRSGDFERTNLGTWMSEPYGRVVLLHLGLIGGGFLLSALEQPVAGLIVLVFLKIGMDVRSLIQRRKRIEAAHRSPQKNTALERTD